MGNSLEIREFNSNKKKCHTLNIPTTLNHLLPLNDKFLISSEYKSFEFYHFQQYLDSQISEDHIFLINIKKEKYTPAKIIDFPRKIPFHPHGLSLYKKSENNYILYVVNHAVSYIYDGEERIEKINISYNPSNEEVTMIYDSSIVLPNEYFLRVDSISVIDQDIFYFTTNTVFPSPGSDEDLVGINKIYHLFYDFLKTFVIMFNIKKCNTYIYNNKVITVVEGSESLLNKGIAYDKKRNLLYLIKSMEKELNIFEVNKNETEISTKLIKKKPILYVGNNVYYDEKKDLIYIGINGKMDEYNAIINSYPKNKNLINVDIYSGYEVIDPKNDYSIYELKIMKNDYKWVSSALQIDNHSYMTSIFTNGIYICEK
jgi:hypothetical protein